MTFKVSSLLSALPAIASPQSRQAGSMSTIPTVTLKATLTTLAWILISHGVKSGTRGVHVSFVMLTHVALTVTIHRSMVNSTQHGEAWHTITSLSWLLQCPGRVHSQEQGSLSQSVATDSKVTLSRPCNASNCSFIKTLCFVKSLL